MNTNARKYRHGTAAVAITAGVLALLILLNIGFTLLSERFLLYLDVTKERYNEISAESQTLLDELDPDENDITIYFLADVDELDDPSLGYIGSGSTTDLWGMRYVYELALRYAATYSFIKVGFLSIKHDYDRLAEYRSTVGVTFGKTTVIVDNYTGETDENGELVKDANGNTVMHHNYRICERDNFFRAESETNFAFAFDGDYRFTSVILSLAGKNPTVYFVGGHGEKIGDISDKTDFGQAQALRDVFFDAGFVTKKIDLKNDYMTVFNDPSARVLVIFGPDKDYSAYGSDVNEMSLIHKFACSANHNLMFFIDGDTSEPLDNLKEYMYDYCGVSFSEGRVKDIGTGGISDDGFYFTATYDTDTYSIGSSLLESLNELDSQPAVALGMATPLYISEKYVQTPSNASSGFYENAASTISGAMFLTPSTSVEVDGAGNTVTDYSESGTAPVMTLTYESWLGSNNKTTTTYTLICGTTAFAEERFLKDVAYGNGGVMTLTMRLMGKEVVPFEIDFKVIQSEEVDMTGSEVTTWTVLLTALVPVAALTLGTIVYLKRRHM